MVEPSAPFPRDPDDMIADITAFLIDASTPPEPVPEMLAYDAAYEGAITAVVGELTKHGVNLDLAEDETLVTGIARPDRRISDLCFFADSLAAELASDYPDAPHLAKMLASIRANTAISCPEREALIETAATLVEPGLFGDSMEILAQSHLLEDMEKQETELALYGRTNDVLANGIEESLLMHGINPEHEDFDILVRKISILGDSVYAGMPEPLMSEFREQVERIARVAGLEPGTVDNIITRHAPPTNP